MAFHPSIHSNSTTKSGTFASGASSASSCSQYISPVTPRTSCVPRLRGDQFGQSYIYAASDSELLSFARASGIVPDEGHDERREAAVEELCKTIGASRERGTMQGLAGKQSQGSVAFSASPSTSPVKLVLAPVGSYGMGIHFPDSGVDCIVVGNIRPASFWAIVQQSLSGQMNDAANSHNPSRIVLSGFVKDTAVRTMLLHIGEFRFRIQYTFAVILAENWSRLENSTEQNSILPDPSLTVLNAYRDRVRFRDSMRSFGSFQVAFRLIKLFCIRRGIYGPHLGFLGDEHLTVMLRRTAVRLPDSTSAFELIKDFLREYSTFDWASRTVSVTDIKTTYRRSVQELMIIISSQNYPTFNIAANASFSTRQTIIRELCLAYDSMTTGMPLPHVWRSEADSVTAFLDDYASFAKIDVNYWGTSCTSARAFIADIESRIARLLIDLPLADQATNIRLWPDRLIDSSQKVTGGATSFVQGFYLLGFQPQQNDASTRPLIGVLESLEETVRKNPSYFDASTCFFAAAVCAREDIKNCGSIEADKPVWRDGGIDEPLSAEEDSEAGIGAASHLRDPEGNRDRQEYFGNQLAKKQHKCTKVSKIADCIPGERLRTSTDIYNRLVWDPVYDEADYLIGYEDRFLGTKEMPLKNWSRQVDDENFIPFHRIAYFRRKSTGEIVWDRRTRLDGIFGSGILTSANDFVMV